MDAGDVAILLGTQLISAILNGASLDTVKELVQTGGAPVWFQDEEGEGISPLHAAAYVHDTEMVRWLIGQGAVWNAVDNLKNTAGDVALSLMIWRRILLYGMRVFVQAELLLGLLESKNRAPIETPSNLVLKQDDDTAAASTDAFLSSKLIYTTDDYGQKICMVKVPKKTIVFTGENGEGEPVVEDGEEEIGVMMGWEQGIMEETVRRLTKGLPEEGLTVLNVGFGLGIIDTLFEFLPTLPAQHVIIEPHPDVLAHMRAEGWYDKPNITILEGKWQDFIANGKLLEFGGFDIVYTDTFSEDYAALRAFFEELPDLLSGPDARFSFFNGLGATNALFYDVYTHISELNLADIGLDVQWSDVDVTTDEEERWGQSREYFNLPIYRLPIAKMKDMMA
ncbi:arginine methyl transferase [Ephemerocybe angulata]|uniref:Arginine methyl transferase n=1 Tax=Ephemerocybe angulata TaxID=980116 RepID=A0A8H6I938_9AGAR|nr:arginine methyl transferase [Tulosesus angulatus]